MCALISGTDPDSEFDVCMGHEHYIIICLYGMCCVKIQLFLYFTCVVFLSESITSAAVTRLLFSISRISRWIHEGDVSPRYAEGGVHLPQPVSGLCGFIV